MSGMEALRRKKAQAGAVAPRPLAVAAAPAGETSPAAPPRSFVVGGGQVRRREILRKPLARLHPDPNQPRRIFDDAELSELARSLEMDGLQQPLLVRPHDDPSLRDQDHYVIVAGERRYRAAQRNGYVDIEVIVYDGSDPARAALIENLLRTDLSAMEQAKAIERLARKPEGDTHSLSELANMLPLSRGRIGHLLQIAALPTRIQEALLSGQRQATSKSLLVVAREKDPDSQWKLFLRLSTAEAEPPGDEPRAPMSPGPATVRSRQTGEGADVRRSTELARRLNRKITHLLGSDLPPEAVSAEDLAHYRVLHERLGRLLATLSPSAAPNGQ